MNRSAMLAVLVTIAALSTGCSGSNKANSDAKSSVTVTYVSGSRIRSYKSLNELAKDADLIAEVTIGPNRLSTEAVAEIPFEILSAKITRVTRARGNSKPKPGDEIKIRQLGTGPTISDAETVSLTLGSSYMLFLSGFRLTPGGPPTDQYVVVGVDAGLFRQGPDGRYQRGSKVEQALPESVALSEIEDAGKGNP